MEIHLQDFMGQHPFLLWLSIAPLFWAAEVLVPRRIFVLWGLAAAVGGVIAALWPTVWWLQLGIAVIAAALLHLWLRPRLLGEPAGQH